MKIFKKTSKIYFLIAALAALALYSQPVKAALATKIAFTAQPSAVAAMNAVFAQQPVVSLQDSSGNTDATATSTIIISPFLDAACTTAATGTLMGATSVSASAGSAAFINLSYGKAETIYLKASDSGGVLTTACSNGINVYAPTLSSIAVAPLTATTTPGGTQQFTATAYDQNNVVLSPQPAFTWSSASTSTASVNSSGLATGAAAGTANITAASTAVSGTATLHVIAAPALTSIIVRPNNGIVKIADTLQLHATGLDQAGAPLALQPVFTWASASTTIASVSTAGLVTGLAMGTTTISATSGAISGSANITVSTSTRIELIGDDALERELEDMGALVPEAGEDFATSTDLIATHDIHVTIHSSAGDDSIDLPSGDKISMDDGTNIDGNNLMATSSDETLLSGFGSDQAVKGAIKWGILNKALRFSSPISVSIFVGGSLNGQTLNVVRSIDGSSGWTADGIVAPATCIVANGLCAFQAAKASYYAATATVTSSSGGSGGGGGGGSIGGAVIMPTASNYGATSGGTSSGTTSTAETSPAAPQVLGNKTYGDGSLLRGPDNKIYVIVSGMKMRILNLRQLKQYKGRAIYNVTGDILAQYPEVLGQKIYQSGALIRGADMKIYVIVNGMKRRLLNLQQLKKYRGQKINNVSNDVLAQYPNA